MAPKDICRQSKHRVLLDLLTLTINMVKPTEFVIGGTQRSYNIAGVEYLFHLPLVGVYVNRSVL